MEDNSMKEFSFFSSSESSIGNELSKTMELLDGPIDVPSTSTMFEETYSGASRYNQYYTESAEQHPKAHLQNTHPGFNTNFRFPYHFLENDEETEDETNETNVATSWMGVSLNDVPSRESLFPLLMNPSDGIVTSIPTLIPSKKGVYLCYIMAKDVKHPSDIYRDSLGPWNVKSSHMHTRYYDFTSCKRVYKKSDCNNEFVAVSEGTHPEYDIDRKVFSIRRTKLDTAPPCDSYYALCYIVKSDFTYTPATPRMTTSSSINLQKKLQHSTPKKAFMDHLQENGGLLDMNVDQSVSLGQIRSLAKRTPNRTTPCRSRCDDASIITQMIKQKHPYIQARHVATDDDRILLASKSMLKLARESMMPTALIKRMNKKIDKICEKPLDAAIVTQFVQSAEYQQWQRCGIVYVDTTFDMSSYYLTVAYVSVNNFVVKKTNNPTFAVAGLMLSKRKDKEAYKWFGDNLKEHMKPSSTKSFRALCTDQDRALDAFGENSMFQEAVNIHCGEHASRNLDYLANGNTAIKKSLFGYQNITRNCHVAGIFDETNFADFSKRLTAYAASISTSEPDVSKRLADTQKHFEWFLRFGLPSRLKAGFGFHFATTNSVEGYNQTTKLDIRSKMSVQDLVSELIASLESAFTVFASAVYSEHSSESITLRNGLVKPTLHQWRAMTRDEKVATLAKFGLCHLEEMKSFSKELYQIDIPLALSEGIPLDTKLQYTAAAKLMTATQIADKFAVVDESNNLFVSFKGGRYVCPCKQGAVLCPHIMAIQMKYPEKDVYATQILYLESETERELAKRNRQLCEGTKPGTRRHGLSPSRNKPFYPNTIATNDEEPCSSQKHQALAVSVYQQNQSQLTPQKRKTIHFDESSTKRQRLESCKPIHFNENYFYAEFTKALTDNNRRCCNESCKRKLIDNVHMFRHNEDWIMDGRHYTSDRYVCSVVCIKQRYPYANSTFIKYYEGLAHLEGEVSTILG